MRMVELIHKKQKGLQLSSEELLFFVCGIADDTIPACQAAAMLMAIYFTGMTDEEISKLALHMAASGKIIDLSSIPGIKVDKHSTGGIGDKTTLIVAPLVASCGVPVAKMSGKGLGFTGGTIDKLEGIPGFQTSLSEAEFIRNIKDIGVSISSQTCDLAPADKKIYDLRNTTSTVESTALIASSIMSKKIAAGADAIVLDVKYGSGAFMKSFEDALTLSKIMVEIGKKAGKRTIALVTDMNNPLGNSIGNLLEVKEAILTLDGKGSEDLAALCVEISANMLLLAEKGDYRHCKSLAEDALLSKKGFKKFKELVKMQHGDLNIFDNIDSFARADYSQTVISSEAGFISSVDGESLGLAALRLGAGRYEHDLPLDYAAGITIIKKRGDFAEKGEVLAIMHSNDESMMVEAQTYIETAYSFSKIKPKTFPTIAAKVSAEYIEYYS